MSMIWKPFLVISLCACTTACTAELPQSGDVGDVDELDESALALPPSLQGTEPDGTLHVDAHGDFVADADAMRLFDYVLTAQGEVPEDDLHALAHAIIHRRLPAAAAAQAVEAFERYLDYRAQASEIASNPDQPVALARDRLLRLHAETVADMPGLAADPILFNRAAALHRVISDPSLDRRTRAARVLEIEAATPQDQALRQAQHQTRLLLRLREAEQRLRAQGGSEGELQALRAELVGPAAARRLAGLDQERARWQQRVAAYRNARAALLSRMSASGERDQALAALRAQRFTPQERVRLRAFDLSSPSR